MRELVLAQTEEQSALMRKNFGLSEAPVLPNFLEIPPMRDASEDLGYVLWVGSLARRKRPELFLELARSLPDTQFRLVGGPGEDVGYDEEMRRRASEIPNLEFVGFVPPPQMDPLYRGASVYVNTSRLEGLPNAMLQAWSHGVPTLSAGVDPDGVIREKRLGAVETDGAALALQLERFVASKDEARQAGQRGHDHVARNHSISEVGGLASEYFELAHSRSRHRAAGR